MIFWEARALIWQPSFVQSSKTSTIKREKWYKSFFKNNQNNLCFQSAAPHATMRETNVKLRHFKQRLRPAHSHGRCVIAGEQVAHTGAARRGQSPGWRLFRCSSDGARHLKVRWLKVKTNNFVLMGLTWRWPPKTMKKIMQSWTKYSRSNGDTV